MKILISATSCLRISVFRLCICICCGCVWMHAKIFLSSVAVFIFPTLAVLPISNNKTDQLSFCFQVSSSCVPATNYELVRNRFSYFCVSNCFHAVRAQQALLGPSWCRITANGWKVSISYTNTAVTTADNEPLSRGPLRQLVIQSYINKPDVAWLAIVGIFSVLIKLWFLVF